VTENKQEESDKSNVITVRLQGSILSQYVSGLAASARWKARFLFDGSRVTHNQTPADLDMEDDPPLQFKNVHTGGKVKIAP
uniref:Rad60/SUMO-like domain-containing protein n=1 Tax=Sinocyclocheilus rhinocerous TaxID=307959 RepID=A0A673M2Q8_9TELE